MLDGFDVEGPIAQTRPPRAFKHVFDQGRNSRLVISLLANKGDPRARAGGADGEGGVLAGE